MSKSDEPEVDVETLAEQLNRRREAAARLAPIDERGRRDPWAER